MDEVSPYKYLTTGNKKIYDDYVRKNLKNVLYESKKLGFNESVWNSSRMDDTLASIRKNGYDPSKMCICVDENNIVLDGQHRACCILYIYGKDYEIDVCRVYKKK